MKFSFAVVAALLMTSGTIPAEGFFAGEENYYASLPSGSAHYFLKTSEKCAKSLGVDGKIGSHGQIILQRINPESGISSIILIRDSHFELIDCVHRKLYHGEMPSSVAESIKTLNIKEEGFYSFNPRVRDGEYYFVTDNRGSAPKRLAAYEPLSSDAGGAHASALTEAQAWARVFEGAYAAAPVRPD